MRLTKDTILFKVQNFGIHQEHSLIKQDRTADAYQIRHARQHMTWVLFHRTVKAFMQELDDMTTRWRDDDGYWHYGPAAFVMDAYTRGMVVELKEKLEAIQKKERTKK